MDWYTAVNSFKYVAKQRSFSDAALHLGVSASAVSKRIEWLEQQLKSSLLIRTTRRVSLTEAGEAFLKNADIWLAQFDNMIDSVQGSNALPQGVLKIAAPQAVGSSLLLPNINRFLAAYPTMRVQLDVLIPGEMPDLEHDIVITRYHEEFDSTSHKGTRLIDYEMMLFASPEYLAKNGPINSINELAKHNILLNNYYMQKGAITLANNQLFEFNNVNFVTDNVDAILKAALLGMGLIFISPHFVTRELDSAALVPVLPDIKTQQQALWVYYPNSSYTPLKTTLFINHLRQSLLDFKL